MGPRLPTACHTTGARRHGIRRNERGWGARGSRRRRADPPVVTRAGVVRPAVRAACRSDARLLRPANPGCRVRGGARGRDVRRGVLVPAPVPGRGLGRRGVALRDRQAPALSVLPGRCGGGEGPSAPGDARAHRERRRLRPDRGAHRLRAARRGPRRGDERPAGGTARGGPAARGRRAELPGGRRRARVHRADGSHARQPGAPTDRERPRDRPSRCTDRTGAEAMATTIEYLNTVHGDLLDAARREARPAQRPPSRWVPSTGVVAAVVSVLVAAGLIGLLVRSGGFASDEAGERPAAGSTGGTGSTGGAVPGSVPNPAPEDESLGGFDSSGPPAVSRVIRTAELAIVIRRDAFDERVGEAVDVAEEQGGFVADSRSRSRSGSLTVRVPAANFDETLHALRELGTVEVESVHGKDVTADYVDLHANLRIARARRE